MPQACPRAAAAVFCCPGETGLVAYDAATDRIHRLSPIASLLVELCDGTRSAAAVTALVQPLLPPEGAAAAERCLGECLALGLLQQGPSAAPPPDPLALARRLRAEGKIEAAYICQSCAAERAPDQAAHWAALGELAHILGRREAAKAAYTESLRLHPQDAEIRHLLVALSAEPPPPRADVEAVRQLYARFAPFYDSNMLEELDYQGPAWIADLVQRVLAERDGLQTLDLGCGSGLAGVVLRPRSACLVGVDLSAPMIALARARGVYDRLEVAEICDWLRQGDARFDLITACDSLIYFGALDEVLRPAAARLHPGGALVFTLELGDQAPFRLGSSGRYCHHPDAIRELARHSGLEVAVLEQGYLRMEYGAPVTGLCVALTPTLC